MPGKKSAAAGVLAAGEAARSNPYVQRLIEDKGLRDDIQTAYASTRKVYGRLSNGRGGPAKVLIRDKKTQRELRRAAKSLKGVADSLRASRPGRKLRLRAGLLGLVLVGAGVGVALNEDLRKKVLDGLFGGEEEFEYSGTTTPR